MLRIPFYFLFILKTLTSAPNSINVSISTAVCIVICRHPAILAPFSGFEGPNFFRRLINPGISFSDSVISFLPHSANLISAETEIHNYTVSTELANLILTPNTTCSKIIIIRDK